MNGWIIFLLVLIFLILEQIRQNTCTTKETLNKIYSELENTRENITDALCSIRTNTYETNEILFKIEQKIKK